MKKQFSLLLLFFCFLHAQEDFIDELEYGKKLYENPRGISCQKCHGANGEEKLIATYKNKEKEKKLIAPQINHLSLEDFAKEINSSKGLMPKYNLTEKEIQAIYKFLKSKSN